MNPIPTANAMKPAPGKGVSSFPTPVIKDTVIVEVVNAWKGDYQPLEYGTKWDDVPHASVQGSFPDHKLVNQSPNSEDGQWVKRIWANDRVDQDTYNYAIKYSGGSDAHPIYIRTYILPREGYAPVPDLSPDPLFPSALLVDEEVQRQEDELDSRYVKVIRTYETLPGPQITSQRYTERGDIETISSQQVSPNTAPDPDGLLVTQSQVIKEDVSKGTKTTATVPSYTQLLVKEKKEGLLGETITTDDIVSPSTNPDELSPYVVSSVVQQTSATKAIKRTTTASGPTSLTKKSRDGKLLGNVTQTQSVVAPDANPNAPSQSILSSEVNQVDSGKAIKTNIVLNSTPTLLGEQTGEGLLGTRTTTESVVLSGASADPVSINVISSQVEPIDSVRSRKITTSSSGPLSLEGARINDRGDIETIEEEIVAAGTNPDPDALLQVSSQVNPIDEAKSKKTTATVSGYTQLSVNEKKEGLLGETITTENIVAPETLPDALSQSVVASVVQQTSATKAVKRTTTASGPTSLTTKSKDGKLLGDVTVTETIVAPDANPDTPSGVQSGILSSEVKQTDSGKGIKRNSVLNSTPTLLGSETKGGLLGATTTEETIVPSGTSAGGLTLSIVSSTVEPIDATRSRRVVVTAGGPTTLSGKQKKEGLLGETTVTETIVVANSEADALSQTIVSSVVEPIDSAKSKKTTIQSSGPTSLTKKQKKEGLLGDVTITESIVAPNAQPDPLSFTVISSEVSQIDSGKSQKTTTESSGPLALNVESLTDSPLGLVPATVQRSIVAQAQLPENGTTVLRDSIQAIDEFKSQRERITVGSWPTNHGQDFDPQFATGFLYEETIVPLADVRTDTGLQNFSEYKIIDNTKALRRRYNKEQIRGILNSQYYKIATAVNIKLPDVLKNVVVYWGRAAGAGRDIGTGIGVGSGTYSASSDSSYQSSGGISGDVYFEISNGFDGQINGFSHEFFLEIGPDGSITNQDILSSLQGGPYLNWPVIRTQTDNIVLISGTKSITIKNSQSVSVNVNGSISNTSGGESTSVDVNANSINVPNCLRGIIEITENFIGDEFAGKTAGLRPTYGFFPEILPATTPASFPTGKYLYSSNVELYKWGFVKVNAVTVEITAAHVN